MSKQFEIKHVQITNWTGPAYWDGPAKQNPDEPLIEATMDLKLSYNEYHKLLQKDRED